MKIEKAFLFSVSIVFLAGVLFASSTALPQAEDGLYVNEEKRFSVAYPAGWEKAPPPHPSAVLFVKDPSVTFLNAGIYTGPTRFAEMEALPEQTVTRWARSYPRSSGHKVESRRMFNLECGTRAIEFVIAWNWGPRGGGEPFPIKTVCVVAEQGEGWVWVDSTCRGGEPIDINRKITNSLRFYK